MKTAQLLMVKAPHGELHCSRDWLQQDLQVLYFLHIHIFNICAQTPLHLNLQVLTLLGCPAQSLSISHTLLRQWAFWQGTEQHTVSFLSLPYSNYKPLLCFCNLYTHVRVAWDSENECRRCLWIGGFIFKCLCYTHLSLAIIHKYESEKN